MNKTKDELINELLLELKNKDKLISEILLELKTYKEWYWKHRERLDSDY